jgi:Fe2+ or Zn2+ uptake regulation protein
MSGIVERPHRAGLRATGPRVHILTALEQDRSHPTAEQLFEALRPQYPFLALSTVYHTFDAFIRTGLCQRVSGAGDRMRVDGTQRVGGNRIVP